MNKGIIIVDHGSKKVESNQMLLEVVDLFHQRFSSKYNIIEPAHMELVEPSIETAYNKCVEKGADFVIICPFFLGPGRHWQQDIPSLALEASKKFPGTNYHVSKPLGVDDLILDLLEKRLSSCTGNSYSCPACEGTSRAGNL